ncbi:MAG: tryptophan synthase alpha chain [Myxococcota bacterium]|jgi:tryptophan synthase alpha chain
MTGIDRIESALSGGAASGIPRIVPFLTAGYPSPDAFRRLLPLLAEHADAIEVGVPFSDPMADGVTIQEASQVALEAGVTLRGILADLADLKLSIPVLLMSYLNPLLAYGPDRLAEDAAAAGVCGFIVPDLPYEERALLGEPLQAAGLALVQLVTPLTPPARLAAICAVSRGFVYAVTRTGTTGDGAGLPADLADYLDRVRAVSPRPVLAGFGIRSGAQVAALSGHADGAIVGSALLKTLAEGGDAVAFLQQLRQP